MKALDYLGNLSSDLGAAIGERETDGGADTGRLDGVDDVRVICNPSGKELRVPFCISKEFIHLQIASTVDVKFIDAAFFPEV